MLVKKTIPGLLILVFLLVAAVRFVHLSADPPPTLSLSGAPYGDPAGYAYNARNKVLFGKWVMDDFNPMYHTLIPHYVTYGVFLVFGLGIAQMNLVPILFSLLGLLILTRIAHRAEGGAAALLALIFLGLNYLFLMYSRLGNRIMPTFFFLLLALLFIQKGQNRITWYLPAGMACFLAFITKAVCLYVIAAFVLGFSAFQISHFERRRTFSSVFWFFSGFAAGFLPWFVFVYKPYGHVLRSMATLNRSFLIPPNNLLKMLEFFWTRPSHLFNTMPVLSVLSSLFFLALVFKITHSPKKVSILEWVLVFWFAAGFIYLSIIYQRFPRRIILMIVPSVLLAVLWLIQLLKTESIKKPSRFNPVFGLALFAWLVFPTSHLLKEVLAHAPASLSNLEAATAILAGTCGIFALLTYLLYRAWPEDFKLTLPISLRRILVLSLSAFVLIIAAQQYLTWALHPEFKLKTISQDLGKALDDAVIAGLWAPAVTLENSHRAHEYFPDTFNSGSDFLQKYRVSHVLATDLWNNQEVRFYKKGFPDEMAKARVLARYPIGRANALLYDLHPSPGGSLGEYRFEAEAFTGPAGLPRYDPGSSAGFAVSSTRGRKGFLLNIPVNTPFPRGTQTFVFRISVQGIRGQTKDRIARLDAVHPDSRRTLGVRNLYAADLSAGGGYLDIPLEVRLPRPMAFTLRLYTDGQADLRVDMIFLQPSEDSESLTHES